MWYGGHESWVALVLFAALFAMRMIAVQRRRGRGGPRSTSGFFGPYGAGGRRPGSLPGTGSPPPTSATHVGTGSRGTPPGWFADPFARHELRYWTGTAWSEHVSDAGTPETDPPPGSPAAPPT